MAKYIKFVVETDTPMKNITEKARKFASENFDKYIIYAWDTERVDDTYSASFSPEHPSHESCGRAIGSVAGRQLICGKDDYLCPECRNIDPT